MPETTTDKPESSTADKVGKGTDPNAKTSEKNDGKKPKVPKEEKDVAKEEAKLQEKVVEKAATEAKAAAAEKAAAEKAEAAAERTAMVEAARKKEEEAQAKSKAELEKAVAEEKAKEAAECLAAAPATKNPALWFRLNDDVSATMVTMNSYLVRYGKDTHMIHGVRHKQIGKSGYYRLDVNLSAMPIQKVGGQ